MQNELLFFFVLVVGPMSSVLVHAQGGSGGLVWGGFDVTRGHSADFSFPASLWSEFIAEITTLFPQSTFTSTSRLTTEYLSTVDVFVNGELSGETGSIDVNEQAALVTWVESGGILISFYESGPLAEAYKTFTVPFGIGATFIEVGGVTNIFSGSDLVGDSHGLFDGVHNILFSYFGGFSIDNDDAELLMTYRGYPVMAVLENYGSGNGAVLVISDSSGFINGNLYTTHKGPNDNGKFTQNIASWAYGIHSYSVPATKFYSECSNWHLAYDLNIPSGSYNWDTSAHIPYSTEDLNVNGFSRVAYLLTLDEQWVYTSMPDFAGQNVAQLGVPTDWVFDINVCDLYIESNVGGVNGGGCGSIEFWPHCYGTGDTGEYDINDAISSNDCYGSMQVHWNHQPIWAFNRWSSTSYPKDLGIGENPSGHPDWTFSANADSFDSKNLKVFVCVEI